MATFDTPNISVEKKTNEQNMQAVKAYLTDLAENLNYVINQQNAEMEALRAEIAEIKK